IALSSFSSNYATGTAVEIDDGRFLSENALAFTVEDGSLLGTYAFSKTNGDDKQYLAYSGSSTGLTLSNTLDSNATWTVAFDNGKAQVVNCGATTRGLIYRLGTYNRFACYANNNASSTSTEYFHAQIYTQLPASEEAAIWAVAFLSTWTAGCNSAGGYDSASMDWAAAKTAYNALSSGAKSALQTSGYGTTDVGKAAERYDYIVGKYGTSAFEDFLGRSPSPIQHAYLIASFLPPAGTAALGIAFLIAASGIIVLATTLRKRKEK
ncbi:MAG: hypothetical protein K6E59_02370, partial [Bacilli bacterium]|nr:hypothetical protein [Bacilli bacterium]